MKNLILICCTATSFVGLFRACSKIADATTLTKSAKPIKNVNKVDDTAVDAVKTVTITKML